MIGLIILIDGSSIDIATDMDMYFLVRPSEVAEVTFTKESVEKIRDKYHNVPIPKGSSEATYYGDMAKFLVSNWLVKR